MSCDLRSGGLFVLLPVVPSGMIMLDSRRSRILGVVFLYGYLDPATACCIWF